MTEQITFSQNQSKWKAASEFASKNGLKFIILTEKDIVDFIDAGADDFGIIDHAIGEDFL